LVLDEKNDNEEGCFWKEGYIGKVASMLEGAFIRANLSVD
jgi:hypothetical protein